MCTEYILLLCSHSRRYLRCACLTGACTRSVVVHLYCNARKFAHVTPEMLFASTPPHTRPPARCSAPRARRNSSCATSPYISGHPIPRKFETGNGGTPVRRKCKTIATAIVRTLCTIYTLCTHSTLCLEFLHPRERIQFVPPQTSILPTIILCPVDGL